MICKTNKKQVTIRAIVNFRPFSILFALEEMAASVAPLLVFRWLDRLLRRFIIHVDASAAHLPSPMSTSLYPLVALQSPLPDREYAWCQLNKYHLKIAKLKMENVFVQQ